MARGTVIGQLLMLAAIPALARVYGVEAFGAFGIFSTVSLALSVAAAGRFEQAIVPAATDRSAIALVHLSLGVVVLVCLVLAGALLAVLPASAPLLGSAGMVAALTWLPLGVASQAISQILLQWATRQHRDRAIARFYAERALVMCGTQLVLGGIGTVQNGLILGQVAGFVAASLLLWLRLPGLKGAASSSVFREAMQAGLRCLDFPRYGMPRALVDATATVALPMLVATLYGTAAMGGYWMAMRVLNLPAAILGDPMRQVFFRRASERQRSGQPLVPLLLRACLALTAITVPWSVILLLGSGTIFAIVLGPEWSASALYAKFLALAWWATFATTFIPAMMVLLGLQRQHFRFEILLRIMQAGVVAAGSLVGGILVSFALLSAVDVAYVGLLLWFLRSRESPPAGAARLASSRRRPA